MATPNIYQSVQEEQQNLAASYWKRQYHNAVKALELCDGEQERQPLSQTAQLVIEAAARRKKRASLLQPRLELWQRKKTMI